uniref:Uncharacterized protein n=1 Tax=Manihot esculenta TaxID=3983 RepID=A0A2C9V068_MANES
MLSFSLHFVSASHTLANQRTANHVKHRDNKKSFISWNIKSGNIYTEMQTVQIDIQKAPREEPLIENQMSVLTPAASVSPRFEWRLRYLI